MSASTPIVVPLSSDMTVTQPAQHIKVVVRLRPTSSSSTDNDDAEQSGKPKKLKAGDKKAWTLARNTGGAYDSLLQKGMMTTRKVEGRSIFHFDQIFDEHTKTPLLYKSIARPMVKSVLSGRHGTIFAYGQTGSGKTFTMQGDNMMMTTNKGQAGIIQLVASDLFRFLRQDETRNYTVRLSYIEIYNEKIRDLIATDAATTNNKKKEVTVRTTGDGSISLNCQRPQVNNVDEILDLLLCGNKNRMVAKTDMNEQSSRSHAIFRLTVESRGKNDDDVLRVSDLNLVDLAGSECVKTSNTTTSGGVRQREGAKINQSLLSLSSVIHALSLPPTKKKQQRHINYRDSNLTRILQPHLSGNAEMAVLCCVSQTKNCLEETRSTLKFAARAKLVQMKPKINEVVKDDNDNDETKKLLEAANMKIKSLQTELNAERKEKQEIQAAFDEYKKQQSSTPLIVDTPKQPVRKYTMPSSFGGKQIEDIHTSIHNTQHTTPVTRNEFSFDTEDGPKVNEIELPMIMDTTTTTTDFQLDAVDPKAAQEAISRFMKGQTTNDPSESEIAASFEYTAVEQQQQVPIVAKDINIPPKATTTTTSTFESDGNSDFDDDEHSAGTGGYIFGDVSLNSVTELNVISAPHANNKKKHNNDDDNSSSPVPTEILTISATTDDSIICITDQLVDAERKVGFLSNKLEQSEDLIEALFRDLERARSCIHDLIYRNVRLSQQQERGSIDKTTTAFWKEEAILEQLWLLKGAMYASLFFFVAGGYELFLVSIILMWLVLEYNLAPTK